MDEHAGVEVAGAGAHDEAAGGGQAHRSVDGPAVAHSAHAGAVAEVGEDRAAEPLGSELGDYRLVGQAVEAVAADACLVQLAGQGETAGELGQVPMKVRVETGDLRDSGAAGG